MARDVADDTYYVTGGGKIPVKWTAPEVCLGPAELVQLLRFWPEQFFLKVKTKFHFCKRQVINKSASVILGLIRLIILSYNR